MPAKPAWPPKSAPRLFVAETLSAGAPVRIEGNAAHYLSRVMRVSVDDIVVLCDDETGEWAARVVAVDKRSVNLEAAEKLRDRESVPDIWLCPALLKKDRFDAVLEKATELGVARIAPVITRRCVADKLNADRARTLTTEAAEQCARTALPQLSSPQKLDAMLREWPEGRALFFADELGGVSAAAAMAKHLGPAAILIGPEGGFDDAEREAVRAHPASVAITLGPRILRAETAAIAALSLWMDAAGDWNK